MCAKREQISYFCFSLLVHFLLPLYGQTLPSSSQFCPYRRLKLILMLMGGILFALLKGFNIKGLQKGNKEFPDTTGSSSEKQKKANYIRHKKNPSYTRHNLSLFLFQTHTKSVLVLIQSNSCYFLIHHLFRLTLVMFILRSLSRSPVVYSFVFKEVLCWSGTGHWLVKCWEMHIRRMLSQRAEQLANRMNTLPQDHWELMTELERRRGKILFTSFIFDLIHFRQLKQKL